MTSAPTAEERDAPTAAICRVARSLHAICGEASGVGFEPALSVQLAGLAAEFAFHAELVYDLLPVREGADREALVAVAAPGVDEVLRILGAAADRREAPTLVAVLARVVIPRLAAEVAEMARFVTAELDAPRARALLLIGRDLSDARLSLESTCERLVAASDDVDAPWSACRDAERALVDRGATVGISSVWRG